MKISVYIATSLDGFIARSDGSLDWLPGADGEQQGAEDYGFYAFFNSVDTLVMGRNTYEMVLSFGEWPYADKRVIVLSSTLQGKSATTPDTQIRSCTPTELAKELISIGADHVYIDGGKTIQGFLRAGLVDEMILTRVPILLGSGLPLFGPLEKDIPLTHLATQSYASGFVQSHYRVDN
jgi:dihydrofolate reductase